MILTFDSNGNDKQKLAYQYWADDSVHQLMFGGAKYGGKSYLGCSMIFGDALMYPGTHYFIARERLNDLRKYTHPSVEEVFKAWGLDHTLYYKYNGQDNVFNLTNGSKVFFVEAKHKPSDPDFHGLGSVQMTRGWCEEIGQMHEKAINNLFLTVGRWRNKEYGIKKKMLMTCNPHKGYGYKNFYLPAKTGTLDEDKRFVVALPQDNKAGDPEYIDSLRNNPSSLDYQRLYLGNWEYSDDLCLLFEHDRVLDLFTNNITSGDYRIVADIARYGKDKTVIGLWNGLTCEKIIEIAKSSLTVVVAEIEFLCHKHDISMHRVIVDEDGIGGGCVDMLGCLGFINNSKPLNDGNFNHLKSQCYFYLADMVNKCKVAVRADLDVTTKITEELEVVRIHHADKDGKRRVEPKDLVKEKIGRSPDYADMLMMRMYFEVYAGVGMADGEYDD